MEINDGHFKVCWRSRWSVSVVWRYSFWSSRLQEAAPSGRRPTRGFTRRSLSSREPGEKYSGVLWRDYLIIQGKWMIWKEKRSFRGSWRHYHNVRCRGWDYNDNIVYWTIWRSINNHQLLFQLSQSNCFHLRIIQSDGDCPHVLTGSFH